MWLGILCAFIGGLMNVPVLASNLRMNRTTGAAISALSIGFCWGAGVAQVIIYLSLPLTE